jgi:DNA-binding transcriptional ArsR family regulator
MKKPPQNDLIWKALADATRREILDALAERPQTSGEIVARFDGLCRTNVMKHLDILVAANLVIVRREGRSRWNYLNPVPIQRVCDRWVSKHVKHLAAAMSRLKDHVEERKTQTSQQSVSKKPNRTKK